MNLDSVKTELNQYWNTNIYRIGLIADSIWHPVGDVVESDGSHPMHGLKLNCMGRMIYDYLNFNKPIWRSIEHSDWTFTGGSQADLGFYGINDIDKVRLIGIGNLAQISVTGHSTAVIWFEGGCSGQTVDTGTVVITVSDGGAFVAPSVLGLTGRKTPVRNLEIIVYESVIDSFNTNITYPKTSYSAPAPNESYPSHIELQYNNLDPLKTYTFKIESSSGTIRLGGVYYFTGKTCVVQYSAVPGANWAGIRRIIHNRITINDYQKVLINSLIYHDFDTLATIEKNTKNLLQQLLKRNREAVVIVSCTPGGGVIEDSYTSLGDQEPGYIKGQNFMKEFNHRVAYNITQPLYADYPPRDSVYSVVIGGTTYNLRAIGAKSSEVSYPTWSYRTILIFEYPDGCPIESLTLPATITKISGTGGASFSLTSAYNMPPSFDVHVALMNTIAKYFGIKFIDMCKYFSDLAIAEGETVETTPYPITEGSPLFLEFPTGYENYLSRYFRPNHWDKSANQPAFECLRDELFLNFNFI